MHHPYMWFVLAALALVAELILGTFYFLVIGISMMLVGLGGVWGYLDGNVQGMLVVTLSGLGCWRLWRYQQIQRQRPLEALEVIGQPVVVEQWLSPQQARVQWRGAHWDARLAKGHASLFGEATYIISAQEGNLLWIEPFTDIGSPPVKLH
jgi:membrane protein implicated in regulation of membrane protease activity